LTMYEEAGIGYFKELLRAETEYLNSV